MSKGILNKYKYCFSNKIKVRLSSKKQIALNKEVLEFLKEAKQYNVDLKSLSNKTISDKEKNIVLNIAFYVTNNKDLLNQLIQNKSLTYKSIIKYSDISKDFLVKWKEYKYIYILILYNPKYKLLNEYLNIENTKLNNKKLTLIKFNSKDNFLIYRGIVLRDLVNSSIIITSDGDIVHIKNQEKITLGKEISGHEIRRLKHHKKIIIIVFCTIFIVLSLFMCVYQNARTTIVVKGTSEIKINSNVFKRVIDASCLTSKGKALIFATDLKNKKLDYAIKDVIQYMNENKMIHANKVILFVNRNKINNKDLIATEKYVSSKKIKVLINNCGQEDDIKSLSK